MWFLILATWLLIPVVFLLFSCLKLCMAAPLGLQQEVWIRSLLSGICSIRCPVVPANTRSVWISSSFTNFYGWSVGVIILMDFKSLQLVWWRNLTYGQDGVTCLTWLGGSRYLATGCMDGKVRLWDSLSGDCVRTLNGHNEPIQSLSVSANQEFLVSVSTDGTARVFELHE